ncbi:hypothetical protein, partial [Cellulomonas triticagri]|uniref:hypothetical protein n=1 Tax=Cellulomonas triticagri TaxID=2483352 RepID=UPI001315814F
PVTRGTRGAVVRTLALGRAPGRGTARTLAGAWLLPAAVVLSAQPDRYHRDGGAVTVTLQRVRPLTPRMVLVPFACALVLAVGLGVLTDLVPGASQVLLTVAVAAYAYAATVGVLWLLRGRQERTATERGGPIRAAGMSLPGRRPVWYLRRVVVRDGEARDAFPEVVALLDAVVPAGEDTQALARSAADQDAWTALGLVAPRGADLGLLVRVGRSADGGAGPAGTRRDEREHRAG